MTTNQTATDFRYVGLFRRLFAIFYDCFLLTAILFITTGITIVLNGGKAVEQEHALYPVLVFSLAAMIYVYFTWFWVNGGQTLGMKTWKIRLMPLDGHRLSWRSAGIRFFTSIISWCCCGLGFLWSLFDSRRRCWHDIASNSVLLDLRHN
jgi:uncharacterized RDD family membrane protein YckC